MGNKINEIGKKFKFHKNHIEDVAETDDSSISSQTGSFKTEKKSNNAKGNSTKFRLGRRPNDSQKTILKESLIRAFLVKNIIFNDDLCYSDKECPMELNNAINEPGIQAISDFNKSIYYKFKERTRRGEYPPVEIIDEEIQV